MPEAHRYPLFRKKSQSVMCAGGSLYIQTLQIFFKYKIYCIKNNPFIFNWWQYEKPGIQKSHIYY